MSRARSLGALGLSLIVVGLAAWVVPPAYAQSSAPALATGWWTQQPLAQPVPDDGFEVAWAVEAEQSMAAIRFDTSVAGGGTIFLVLNEIGGSATDQGYVDVCRTANNTWTSANPGSYADRPASDCAAGSSVRLGRDLGTQEWAGDITSLADPSGITSLAVRPMGKSLSGASPPTAPFSVQFGSAEIRYDPPTGPTTTADSGASTTFGTDGGSFSPTYPEFDPDPGFGTPSLGPVETTPGSGDATVTSSSAPVLNRGPVDGTERGPRPWGRLVVLTPISAGIGTLGAAGRRWKLDRS
ncbi:MAG: hypothetical protein ACT452_00460 [Microthrixaceae bacterium]